MSPRIGAYYAIHYGADYLEHSIRSIYDAVDMIGVYYAILPSHGHRDTPYENPDSLEAVLEAIRCAGDPERKLSFQWGRWASEWQHRDFAVGNMMLRGAKLVLVVDSDEVWAPEVLPGVLREAWEANAVLFRLPFLHFWRSFGWVCRDQMMPIRIQKAQKGREAYLNMAEPVYHFGYAQRPEIVRYKASIHGHRGEWRNGWFEEKFMAWSPYPPNGTRVGDVHPTAGGIWYPERFDRELLPALMRSHPYWGKELIA